MLQKMLSNSFFCCYYFCLFVVRLFVFNGEDCFYLISEKKNEHRILSNESLIAISTWYLPFQSNIQMVLVKVTLLISPMSVSQLEVVI